MKKFIFTLLLVSFLCGFANAQNNSKIDVELQKVLNQRSNDLIDIQIFFESSLDTKQLNPNTRQATTKSSKKDIVISELKKHSANVQADVLEILKAEEKSGNVSDINRLWIANSISCKASKSVIYNLSSHPDIKIIGYDKEFQLISPEQMKEFKATSANVRGAFSHITSVNADDVWNLGYTGKNVVVAVLDSGTNTNHIDLKDHLWKGYIDTDKDGTPDTYVNGWNFTVNNGGNSDIIDEFGHGTHCAGIVCGDGTSLNYTGIAPDALLMTVKTVGRSGTGSVAQMLSGVQFAVENGADVLSMSLGFKNSQLTTAQKEEIRAAFDKVLEAGVVVCAAAGNDGDTYGAPNNVDYPAACPAPWRNPDQTLEGGLSSVICVGAHDLDMSSRGPSTWEGTAYNDYPYNEGASMGLIRPDISAMGDMIYSSNYSQNDKYAMKSGTSQATPCVAGVIALMLEKNSTLTPAQISQIIEETAQSKPATKNNTVGAGVVDALAAVNSITETVGNPYVKVTAFAPKSMATGNRTLSITLKNEGAGASDDNTSVTLSLSNDPYVTIENPTQTLGRLGVNVDKTLFFELNIDENTPSGHTATFSVKTTSGTYSWEETYSIKVSLTPNLAFQSVSPGVVGTNATSDIKVTVVNNGFSAFTDPITLSLKTLSSELKYVDLIDTEATIPALGVGESGTGTFKIATKLGTITSWKFDFFLETYSESTVGRNYVYEFENDLEGWTYLSGSYYYKAPWLHSTTVGTLTDVGESNSGKGHLKSISIQDGTAQQNNSIDNYLVSPTKIKVGENTKVSFYARANNYSYYKEHFGFAVSTAGNTSVSDFTTIQEWVITDRTTWKKYTVDLSAYKGQEIYVAIRHYFTEQQWIEEGEYGQNYDALDIDDIIFENVIVNTKHNSTLSYDDPYYFNVRATDAIYLPMVGTITATPMSGAVSLEWDAVNGVSKYGVYRDGQRVATVTDPVYVDEKLSYNKQYCYAVTTIASYESGFSDEVCATTLGPSTTPTPTNLDAMATSESTIDLLWDKVEEAASYNVYQGTELIADGITDTKYTVKNLNAATNYCFVVTAVNAIGESNKSESACATTLKERPAAPVQVEATADSESAITLTWDDVYGALSYKVYQGGEVIASGITKTTYTVTDLDAETKYCFNLTAVNETGESVSSETACATTLEAPKAPEAPVVTATADDDSTITLTWNAVENATSYNVYTGTGTSTTLLASNITETTYTVEYLTPATTYCFNVTAVNEIGESESSLSACATTHEKLTGIIVKSYELTAQTGEATLTATLINKCETDIPAGAKVNLSCNDSYITIVDGTYDLSNVLAINGTATATFTIEIAETVPANYNIEFNISVEYEKLVNGESYNLSYTFDTDLDGCTAISKDTHNYPHNWYHSSECENHKYDTRTYSELNKYNLSLSGEGFIFSESYCNSNNKGFKPDHWIILPEQIVPSDNTLLEFYVCALTGYTSYADETFGVYVSTTSGTDVNSFVHNISNETLATIDKSRFWAKRTVKFSDYKDQKVWVAIRHYGTGNNSAIAIDDITIANISTSYTKKETKESTFTVTVNATVEVNNTYNGTGSWGDNPNWSSGAPTEDDDVVIAGNVTINSGDVIVKSLTINNGYSLTVKSGTSLRVVEDFNNSDANAFIIEDGAQVFVNDDDVAATFNMNIVPPTKWSEDNTGGWQFITSPIADASIGDFISQSGAGYDLFKYVGTKDLQWVNYKYHGTDFETTFQQGRAYLVSYATDSISKFVGTLKNEKSYTWTDLIHYGDNFVANFHLLGNPFTFNIDVKNMQWNDVVEGLAVVNAEGTYEYCTAENNGIIPVGDGFFVKTTGVNPSITYTEGRSVRSDKVESINLIAHSNAGKDNVIINLAGEKEGFNKLDNFNKEIASIFVANKGNRYGIYNCDKHINEVELSFVANKMGNYSISFDVNGEFESLVLVDRLAGIETDMLAEGEYKFIATNDDMPNRFVVKLDNGQQSTVNSQFVYQSGDELIVNAEGTIQIIDMMGRVIYNKEHQHNNRINITHLNRTSYMIRCVDNNSVRVQKIVIQ